MKGYEEFGFIIYPPKLESIYLGGPWLFLVRHTFLMSMYNSWLFYVGTGDWKRRNRNGRRGMGKKGKENYSHKNSDS